MPREMSLDEPPEPAAAGGAHGVALVLAGVLVVGLTRASLVDRIDAELRSIAGAAGPFQRLADLSATDQDAGRRSYHNGCVEKQAELDAGTHKG